MKKILFIALCFIAETLMSKEPAWTGYNIINKTNHELTIKVHCIQSCNKNDPSCKNAYGYVLMVPPNTTVANKKDKMSYECFDTVFENALIIEAINTNGQITVPKKILKNPQAKDYTISLDKNNIIDIK